MTPLFPTKFNLWKAPDLYLDHTLYNFSATSAMFLLFNCPQEATFGMHTFLCILDCCNEFLFQSKFDSNFSYPVLLTQPRNWCILPLQLPRLVAASSLSHLLMLLILNWSQNLPAHLIPCPHLLWRHVYSHSAPSLLTLSILPTGLALCPLSSKWLQSCWSLRNRDWIWMNLKLLAHLKPPFPSQNPGVTSCLSNSASHDQPWPPWTPTIWIPGQAQHIDNPGQSHKWPSYCCWLWQYEHIFLLDLTAASTLFATAPSWTINIPRHHWYPPCLLPILPDWSCPSRGAPRLGSWTPAVQNIHVTSGPDHPSPWPELSLLCRWNLDLQYTKT